MTGCFCLDEHSWISILLLVKKWTWNELLDFQAFRPETVDWQSYSRMKSDTDDVTLRVLLPLPPQHSSHMLASAKHRIPPEPGLQRTLCIIDLGSPGPPSLIHPHTTLSIPEAVRRCVSEEQEVKDLQETSSNNKKTNKKTTTSTLKTFEIGFTATSGHSRCCCIHSS